MEVEHEEFEAGIGADRINKEAKNMGYFQRLEYGPWPNIATEKS